MGCVRGLGRGLDCRSGVEMVCDRGMRLAVIAWKCEWAVANRGRTCWKWRWHGAHGFRCEHEHGLEDDCFELLLWVVHYFIGLLGVVDWRVEQRSDYLLSIELCFASCNDLCFLYGKVVINNRVGIVVLMFFASGNVIRMHTNDRDLILEKGSELRCHGWNHWDGWYCAHAVNRRNRSIALTLLFPKWKGKPCCPSRKTERFHHSQTAIARLILAVHCFSVKHTPFRKGCYETGGSVWSTNTTRVLLQLCFTMGKLADSTVLTPTRIHEVPAHFGFIQIALCNGR